MKLYQNHINLVLKHKMNNHFRRTKLPNFRIGAENFVRRKFGPPKILSVAETIYRGEEEEKKGSGDFFRNNLFIKITFLLK